jgi:hypothetical protein
MKEPTLDQFDSVNEATKAFDEFTFLWPYRIMLVMFPTVLVGVAINKSWSIVLALLLLGLFTASLFHAFYRQAQWRAKNSESIASSLEPQE